MASHALVFPFKSTAKLVGYCSCIELGMLKNYGGSSLNDLIGIIQSSCWKGVNGKVFVGQL